MSQTFQTGQLEPGKNTSKQNMMYSRCQSTTTMLI